MPFAEKLKAIRLEKEMSLNDFADLLGTSKQVLSRYERGENTPKITTVQKYAEVLGIPLSYLTDDEPVPENAVLAELTSAISDMSPEEMQKVMSYVRFIKSGG